jgi:hypothetical protein
MAKEVQPNATFKQHCTGKLDDPQRDLLLPLRIKLGLKKKSVKALQTEGKCFKYRCSKLPGLSEAKLKRRNF